MGGRIETHKTSKNQHQGRLNYVRNNKLSEWPAPEEADLSEHDRRCFIFREVKTIKKYRQ